MKQNNSDSKHKTPKETKEVVDKKNVGFIDPSLDLEKSISVKPKQSFNSGEQKVGDIDKAIKQNFEKLNKPNFYFNGNEITPTDSEMEKLAGQKVLVRESIFEETPEGTTPNDAGVEEKATNLIKNLDEYIKCTAKICPDILEQAYKNNIQNDLERQKNSLKEIEDHLELIKGSSGLCQSIAILENDEKNELKEELEMKKKDLSENIENLENMKNISLKIAELESSIHKIQNITDSVKSKNNKNNSIGIFDNNPSSKQIQSSKLSINNTSKGQKNVNTIGNERAIFTNTGKEKLINAKSNNSNEGFTSFKNAKRESYNSENDSFKGSKNFIESSKKESFNSGKSHANETFWRSYNEKNDKKIDSTNNPTLNIKSSLSDPFTDLILDNDSKKRYSKYNLKDNPAAVKGDQTITPGNEMTPYESLKQEEKKSYLVASELLYLKNMLERLELSKNKKLVDSIQQPEKVVEMTINDCVSHLNDLSKSLLDRGQILYNYSKLISVTPEEKEESDIIFSKIPDTLENNNPFIFKIMRKGLLDFNINLILLNNLPEEQKLLNLHILTNGDFFKDCLCLTIEEKDDLYYSILSKDNRKRKEFENKINQVITDINNLLIPLPNQNRSLDNANNNYISNIYNNSSNLNSTVNLSISCSQSLISIPGQEPEEQNVHLSQVKIYGIEKGSIRVFFDILDGANRLVRQLEVLDLITAHLSAAFADHSIQLHVKPFFNACKLTADQLDPKGNFDFRKHRVENHVRGGMKYFQPLGWKRYGLKVTKKYDGGNDDWLSMSGVKGEWAVGFHGFRNPPVVGPNSQLSLENLPLKIILDQGFKPGKNQAFRYSKCIKENVDCGEGSYFSNHIEVCENGYISNIHYQDKLYKVAFQSRLNPPHIRIPNKSSDIAAKRNDPDWINDYFIVNNSRNIRPYGILLKTVNPN